MVPCTLTARSLSPRSPQDVSEIPETVLSAAWLFELVTQLSCCRRHDENRGIFEYRASR
jgi:hypothetical protein